GRARRRARGHGARPSVHAGAAWRDATTRRRARGPDQTPVASSDRSGRSGALAQRTPRSEEHTSELQSRFDLVCRLLLEKKTHLLPVYALRYYRSYSLLEQVAREIRRRAQA